MGQRCNVGTGTDHDEIMITAGRIQADYSNVNHTALQAQGVEWLTDSLGQQTNLGASAQDNPLLDSEDYHISCGSPSQNKGNTDESVMPTDQYDLNGNANTTERTPDLDLNDRIVLGRVDQGAFEIEEVITCPTDVAPYPCRDGTKNVVDLIEIINNWGACPSPPVICHADINSDDTVNVTDLLAVINSWGPCAASGTAPASVEDCETDCANKYPGYGQDYTDCVQDCVEALCILGILDPEDCPD